MLQWIFGGVEENVVHVHTHDRAAGYLELERARFAPLIPGDAIALTDRTEEVIKLMTDAPAE